MFHFPDSLFIDPLLLHLLLPITLSSESVAVASREKVVYLYIKECTLPISPPKRFNHDVMASPIYPIRQFVGQQLFCHWLQSRLNTYCISPIYTRTLRMLHSYLLISMPIQRL